MASLIDTNPYLRDPEERARMLEENARQSSIFEGARGIPHPRRPSAASGRPVSSVLPDRRHPPARERRRIASAK